MGGVDVVWAMWTPVLIMIHHFMVIRCSQNLFSLQRMTATEMIKFLQDGGRLAKPINCPMDVYKLMLSCWTEEYVLLSTILTVVF